MYKPALPTDDQILSMSDGDFSRALPVWYLAHPPDAFKAAIIQRAGRLQRENLEVFAQMKHALQTCRAPMRGDWFPLVRTASGVPRAAGRYVPVDERPETVLRREAERAELANIAKAMGYADGRIPASAFQHLTQQPEQPSQPKQPINASFPDPDRNPQPTTAQPIKVPPGWRKE